MTDNPRASGGGPRIRRRALGLATATGAAVLLLGLTASATAVEGSRFRPAVQSPGGVVATESAAAARVGRRVLNAGGNAIDAAVASAFAIGVARPQSCGIGGGGFLVYRTAGGRAAALDFRETAPLAVTPTTFTGPGPHRTFTGHRTVGVPGTVAGLAAALDRFGTYTLAEAIAPAERLASRGVRVPPSLSAEMQANAQRLRLFPAAASQFLVGGTTPYQPGQRLVQRRLASTLRMIAREGPAAFYDGPIAERIVNDMQTAEQQLAGDQGLMTRRDLAAYRAVWRKPLVGNYRGRTVIAMPPPTSGGIATLQMLNLLEGFDLRRLGQSSADSLHLIAESQKIAFADRGAYVGDPQFTRVPTAVLTSEAYAARRRAEIDLSRAKTYGPGDVSSGAPARAAGADGNPETNTTHISVLDAAGNAVALTCTIEQSFGSAVVAPGTGVLLNNELTDFSDPGTANEARGGKRPRSSISPTIVVQRNRPVLAVGGVGGARIIMGSLLAVVNVVDFRRDIARAVDAERLDATGLRLTLESGRVPAEVQAELGRRGHTVVPGGEYDVRPRVQAVGVDLRSGRALGVSDPRTDFGTLASRRPRRGGRARAGRSDKAPPSVRLRLTRRGGGVALDLSARDRGQAGLAAVVIQARAAPAEEWRTIWRSRVDGRGGFSAGGGTADLGRSGRYHIRARAVDRAGNVSRFDVVRGFVRNGRLHFG